MIFIFTRMVTYWWHEIVNDVLGGRGIAVTYCPLTGTGITYDRVFAEKTRTLGVSGLLFNSNLVMYDRDSGTLFPQMCPKGVTGSLIDDVLNNLPSVETTWGMWKKMYPNTSIVGFSTGYSRNYNVYPYGNYITNHNNMLFSIQPDDNRLQKKDMVYGIISNNDSKVYPFKFMNDNSVINDEIGSEKIVVLYNEDSQMALAYNRNIDSQILSFQIADIPGADGLPFEFIDEQTGSKWNIMGEAISGSLEGTRLQQIESGYTGFWFSFGSFFPNVEIVEEIITNIKESEVSIPENFRLEQNYPNPFNSETTINYIVSNLSKVKIVIYNMLGQNVRTLVSGNKNPGTYLIKWNGEDDSGFSVQTGIYFYRMEADDFIETRKLILLK